MNHSDSGNLFINWGINCHDIDYILEIKRKQNSTKDDLNFIPFMIGRNKPRKNRIIRLNSLGYT